MSGVTPAIYTCLLNVCIRRSFFVCLLYFFGVFSGRSEISEMRQVKGADQAVKIRLAFL